MIGKKFIAKQAMKKLKKNEDSEPEFSLLDKVKGFSLDGEQDENEGESFDPPDSDDVVGENFIDANEEDNSGDENSTPLGDNKKSKGKGKGKNSVSDIAKLLLKMGIVMGAAITVFCVVMSIITMYTTVTGTAVQLADGSIKKFGEPIVDPNAKKGNADGNISFNGDEYYTKAKMIVSAVQQNPDLKKKADKAKIPGSVPSTLRRRMSGKRGDNYHIVEVAYIFRELCLNDFYKKYKINGNYEVEVTDRFLWAEFMQENTCGLLYEDNWETFNSDSWLEAHTSGPEGDNYRGPFQLQKNYFNGRAYITFIPSLEKDNGSEYGIVKNGSLTSLRRKMKYNRNIRTSITVDSWYDDTCYHFTDMAASANNMSFQAGMDNKYKSLKAVFNSNDDYEASKDSMTAILGDLAHRGPGYYNFSNSGSTIVAGSSSCSTHMVILGQLLQDGLYSEDSLSKLGLNCDYNRWEDWKPWVNKLVKQCSKDSIAGISKDNITEYLSSHAYAGNPDGGLSPFYKPLAGYQSIVEAKAVVDAVFDELGLELPNGGGSSLELKESKGEFQGLWSDKNGKTLTTSEMLAYKGSGNAGGQDNAKLVGLKEQSPVKVNYSKDPFKKKFGDGVGVIWYHQSSANAWGSYMTHPNAGSGNTIPKSFCGGYSTSIVLSTMLHKYINPPEILYAAHSYGARHGGGGCTFTNGLGMFISENQNKLLNEQMFDGKKVLKATLSGELTKTELDKALDAGGMVIGCFTRPIASGDGHFVVIRSKDSDGNYYLADPSHSDRPEEKKVNSKLTFEKLSGWSKGQVNYVVPGPGYSVYTAANSSSTGNSGSTPAAKGNYPYWTQGSWGGGTSGKCTCPVAISGGCYVYSLLKIAKASGAEFDFVQVWNKIQSKGYARGNGFVVNANGILQAAGVNGTITTKNYSKLDFSTESGRKQLAREAKKYMNDGYYVIARIGTSSAEQHFLNISESDGETFNVWDSGKTSTTNAGADTFIDAYKSTSRGKETYLYSLRLVKISK